MTQVRLPLIFTAGQ